MLLSLLFTAAFAVAGKVVDGGEGEDVFFDFHSEDSRAFGHRRPPAVLVCHLDAVDRQAERTLLLRLDPRS